MKAIFAIGCLFLLAAAVRADEDDEVFEILKDDIKACSAEQGISEDQLHKFFDVNLKGDEKQTWGCIQLCVMKRLNTFVDGHIQPENFREHLEKNPKHTDEITATIEGLKKCVDEVAEIPDECEMVYEFSSCFRKLSN
ncbi:hypothetical protein QLX08_001063 [Tetragonisca angustula]